MHKQDLQEYLNSSLSIEEFEKKIKIELDQYKNGLNKKGASVTIRLDGDKNIFMVSQHHYDLLRRDFSNGKCDKYFLSYISDALLLSENSLFESEDLRDKFESFTEI